jgi:hypothetical protein
MQQQHHFVCSSKAVRVEIYASFSPCKDCCVLITDFAKERPGCCVRIFFSCVYRHTEEIHCAALRKLYLSGAVSRLDVFRVAHWLLLRRRGHLVLSWYGWRNMRRLDNKWRDILTEILNPVSHGFNSKNQTPSQKLTVNQMVKTFPTSYGNRMFITAYTRVHLWTLPESKESIPSGSIKDG